MLSCLAELGSSNLVSQKFLYALESIALIQELGHDTVNPFDLELSNDYTAQCFLNGEIEYMMRVSHENALPVRLEQAWSISTMHLTEWIRASLKIAVKARDTERILLIHNTSEVRLRNAAIYDFLRKPTEEMIQLLVTAGYDLNSPRDGHDQWTLLMSFFESSKMLHY